jgi:hypothetical protein
MDQPMKLQLNIDHAVINCCKDGISRFFSNQSSGTVTQGLPKGIQTPSIVADPSAIEVKHRVSHSLELRPTRAFGQSIYDRGFLR